MARANRKTDVEAVRRRWPLGWALWAVPPAALGAILFIEAAAISAVALGLSAERPTNSELTRLALLFVLSAVFTEASDRVDRLRRYVGADRVSVGSMSVWSIAAAVTLPLGWAGLFVIALYAHSFLRARKSSRPHRLILSCASLVLATVSAAGAASLIDTQHASLAEGPRELLALTAAVIAFLLVNYFLICIVVFLATKPDNWRSVLASRDEFALEVVTLILGVLTGEIALNTPWLTPGVLAVLTLLYRGAMVTQLQIETTIDPKTGLLNFNAWRDMARRALLRTERAKQPVALLLIDLDHFKRVNDTYGHLVGDQVLTAVSARIKSDLREYDMIGRFGGEEFVLLLDNADLYAAVSAATRLRENISEMVIGDGIQVTASIGVAHSAKSGATLESLLERADVALYDAKAAGRNTVRALAAFSEVPGDAVA